MHALAVSSLKLQAVRTWNQSSLLLTLQLQKQAYCQRALMQLLPLQARVSLVRC